MCKIQTYCPLIEFSSLFNRETLHSLRNSRIKWLMPQLVICSLHSQGWWPKFSLFHSWIVLSRSACAVWRLQISYNFKNFAENGAWSSEMPKPRFKNYERAVSSGGGMLVGGCVSVARKPILMYCAVMWNVMSCGWLWDDVRWGCVVRVMSCHVMMWL